MTQSVTQIWYSVQLTEALRGTQRATISSSEALRAPTWMFVGGSRRRTSSEANAGERRGSDLAGGRAVMSTCMQGRSSVAISVLERRGSDLAGGRAVMSTCKAGHQWQSVAMYHFSGPPSPPS